MTYERNPLTFEALQRSRVAAEKQHGAQARNAVKWFRTHHTAAPLPNETEDDKRKKRNARKRERRARRK